MKRFLVSAMFEIVSAFTTQHESPLDAEGRNRAKH